MTARRPAAYYAALTDAANGVASRCQLRVLRVLADDGDALAATVVDAADLDAGRPARWEQSIGYRADAATFARTTAEYYWMTGEARP